MTTPRLLAYRKKMLTLEPSAEFSDLNETEIGDLEPGYVYFKDTPGWADLNAILTSLLQDREHFDR